MTQAGVASSARQTPTDSDALGTDERSARVSVIIPVYNREEFIGEAIGSVLAQDIEGRVEIIVVDDGSTDRTAEIARAFGDKVLVLTTTRNEGPSSARNAGIRAATAPVIAFLDSDDIMLPERLRVQLAYLDAHPEIGVALAACDHEVGLSAAEYFSSRDLQFAPHDWFLLDRPREILLRHFLGNQSTTTARKDVLITAGLYNPHFSVLEDWEFMLRLATTTNIACYNGSLAWIRVTHHNRDLHSLVHGAALGVSVVDYVCNTLTPKTYIESDLLLKRRQKAISHHLSTTYFAEGGIGLRALLKLYNHRIDNLVMWKWLAISFIPISITRGILWLRSL